MTSDLHPLGSINRQEDGTYTVALTRLINHPISKVWDAITNPAQVAIWLGQMVMELKVGGDFSMKFYGDHPYQMQGIIKEIEAPTLLIYSWVPTGMPPNVITWRLKEISPTQTELFLSFSNVTERATMAGTGWHMSIQYMIEVMDGTLTSYNWQQETFDDLHLKYAAAYPEVR